MDDAISALPPACPTEMAPRLLLKRRAIDWDNDKRKNRKLNDGRKTPKSAFEPMARAASTLR
ncbi:hypothetical protein LB543_06825 [Mesorhizobium sp. ESP7-2]|uniref:hypothetical protein n=1 Tax=Mesorhizobium sp. ESP7-2 TaxID=2876622 RepID=UPI001CC91EBB|nr:hypothetical protein [Mesorhizobium sp. ESP7-2]MBZ9706436.1 hypothetical protein [Mesorhizobium sp. ESP7-2]